MLLIGTQFHSSASNLDTNALLEMVVHAYNLQQTKPDSAYLIAQEVESISLANAYEKGVAYARMRMGEIENLRGKNQAALKNMRSVLGIRKKLNDHAGAINACTSLSYIYNETGQPDSAFSILYQALKLQEQTNELAALSDIHLQLAHLGRVHHHGTDEILQHLQLTQNISTRLNDTTTLIQVLTEYGAFYADEENFSKSLQYHTQANELLQKQNNPISLISNYNNLAVAYVGLAAYDLAKDYYLKQIKLSAQLLLPNLEAKAYNNLGVLHHQLLEPDSAAYYYLKALEIAQITQDLSTMGELYEKLAATEAQRKNYQEALNYHIKFTEVNKRILNEERISTIAEMQVKYETHQKEMQLQLAREQEKTQRSQKIVFIIGSTVLLLLLAIIILIYFQKQRVNKKDKEIHHQKMKALMDDQELHTYQAMLKGQEEERLRISADLHDRLGSMLSTVKLLFSGLENKIDKHQESHQNQYDTAKNLIDDACVEIRRISHHLGAGMVANFGLDNAVKELCESINQSGTLACFAHIYQMPKDLPLNVQTEIYRMVQESLNNVIKHAEASEVNVQFNVHEKILNLLIEDNGQGFDTQNPSTQPGLGLKSIQNRVNLLKGDFHIDSSLQGGTTLIIDIPIAW